MKVRIAFEFEVHDVEADDVWMHMNDDIVPVVQEELIEALLDHNYNFDDPITTVGPAWEKPNDQNE
jgi:hypothetical protein